MKKTYIFYIAYVALSTLTVFASDPSCLDPEMGWGRTKYPATVEWDIARQEAGVALLRQAKRTRNEIKPTLEVDDTSSVVADGAERGAGIDNKTRKAKADEARKALFADSFDAGMRVTDVGPVQLSSLTEPGAFEGGAPVTLRPAETPEEGAVALTGGGVTPDEPAVAVPSSAPMADIVGILSQIPRSSRHPDNYGG